MNSPVLLTDHVPLRNRTHMIRTTHSSVGLFLENELHTKQLKGHGLSMHKVLGVLLQHTVSTNPLREQDIGVQHLL